jgi:hypothetical protein
VGLDEDVSVQKEVDPQEDLLARVLDVAGHIRERKNQIRQTTLKLKNLLYLLFLKCWT